MGRPWSCSSKPLRCMRHIRKPRSQRLGHIETAAFGTRPAARGVRLGRRHFPELFLDAGLRRRHGPRLPGRLPVQRVRHIDADRQ